MLHITNGDSAVFQIEAAGFAPVLPWRDVLHEGPVPAGLLLEQMSDQRAGFIATWSGEPYDEVRRSFAERDRSLMEAQRLALWFEHDLYDQLQLIQILSAAPAVEIELICTDEYLGPASPQRISELWELRQPVDDAQRDLAKRAWEAFTAPDRGPLDRLLKEDLSALPFLAPALVRHLQEFPADLDGLGRNERQILRAIEGGARTFHDLFKKTQTMEEAIYMGDSALELYVQRLISCRTPLITSEPYSLTEAGRRVLSGQADHCTLNGVDRWIGGVHVVQTLI
jgi:hypothetical protein